MTDDISKKDKLKEDLNEGKEQEQELKEEISTETTPKKDHSHFWKQITPNLLGAVSSLLIAIVGAYVAVHLTQKSNEDQEKLAVLRLLKVSESDVKNAIDDIDSIGEAELNTDDIQGSIISHWSNPNSTSAYPAIFADLITDQRVILSVSDVNLQSLYSYETKLKSSLDAIKLKDDDLAKETYYAIYRDELKTLQLTLSEEIKYQKGELSEKQLAKASESFKSEARKDSPFKNDFNFNNGSESMPKQ